MTLAVISLGLGFVLLVWSADRFIDGSAASARHFGMPPILIGMIIIGFGTSVPEMVVSVLSSIQGNPGIALGNAYGSNITNIALILGITSLISPISVHSRVLRNELPVLAAITGLSALLLWDGELDRMDAALLLSVFAGLMIWAIVQGRNHAQDALARDIEKDTLDRPVMPLGRAVVWLLVGLVLLILSSRMLVWGAVVIARSLGVDDLVIGLTVVAVGTSLPELASSLIATRKGEHDIALGNVLGSNLFNTLAVVGMAGAIHPMAVAPEVLSRDVLTMGGLTLSLFVICYGFRGRPGRINRFEGALLLAAYVAYTSWLVVGVMVSNP
ncbi:MAG: calcium/sodium antiporter [Pseudomonadota bacterium]